MSFSTPPNKTSASQFLRTEAMLTVEDLKTRYLFGIDLTDEKGNELPDKTIQHAINSSVSYLEHKLNIIITKTSFTERYDYRSVDYIDFNLIQLKNRPLCSVEAWRAKFPTNKELVEYPKEWFVLEKESGQIQLSPVEGTFSGLIVSQGGAYLPLIYGTRDHWPHLFEVEYTAGFDSDCIPVFLNEMIGMQASIRLFEILGDIVIGSGIASETVGIDAANVSRNTTASATFSAFSARTESYKKQMEDYIKTAKQYYNGIAMVVG